MNGWGLVDVLGAVYMVNECRSTLNLLGWLREVILWAASMANRLAIQNTASVPQ